MNKKIALIQNYDRLGGAEKSGLEQAKLLTHFDVDIFLPSISENQEYDGIRFEMPRYFFKISRSTKNNYFLALFSFLSWFLFSSKIPLKRYDAIWFNGLKVFLLHIPLLLINKNTQPIYFHLRDYIIKNKIFSLILFLVKKRQLNIFFIANSLDIKNDFLDKYGSLNFEIEFCYNPCHVPVESQSNEITSITLASMLTPWKGIHTILQFINIYKNELNQLGIKDIHIFGDSIYSTNTLDLNYKNELLEYCKNNSLDMVKFHGKKNREYILSNCSLLIHSSIEKEPFGRVILEAMGAKIPVLSTGLGGASEIFSDELKEYIFTPYDHAGLFEKIKFLCNDTDLILLKERLKERYNALSSQGRVGLIKYFEENV